jgi:hypothetical protein
LAIRTWVGLFVTIALCGARPALASSFFLYRDAATGCEVYVERADSVPRASRDDVQLVSASVARAAQPAAEACARAAAARVAAAEQRRIESAMTARAVDARLMRNGGRSLSESELEDLRRLCSPRVSTYILALLAALVAWIAVMVAAFREDHLGWAIVMLFLSAPGAFIYLFLGLGRDRPRFKAVCALGMLAPALVFFAWHLYPGAPH